MPQFMLDANRIVGGEAAPSPIPWQVALLSGSFQFCGATILDASTLLCAAHCTPSTSHKIRVGTTNKQSGGQTRNIAQVIYNNNAGFQYNSGTLENDFVILKLDSPLTLNADVQPACLPSSASYLGVSSTEERCFTSGWGTLSSGGSSTNNLMYVRVPAITNAQCNNAYGGSITNSMICAGYPGVGGKDACQGDSGGPFICNEGGKAILAGVVSWGNGCALADYPGVYARTTHVLDWIKSNMGSSGAPAPPPGPTTTTQAPTNCGSPQWATDQWCDDENNNADCNWDGGACCDNDFSGWDTYCTACECLEPTTTTTTTTTAPPPTSGCGSPQWANDQWCDDENNNEECNFDGGACCFNDYSGWDTYCNDCECIGCHPLGWHGDGYCDDGELNTENCKWDGGDCCGDNVDTSYCTDCQCLDPNA